MHLEHVLWSGLDESISVSGLRVVEFYCSPHAWIRSPDDSVVEPYCFPHAWIRLLCESPYGLGYGAAVPLGYKYDSVVLLGFPSIPLASQQICLRSSKDTLLYTLQSPTL